MQNVSLPEEAAIVTPPAQAEQTTLSRPARRALRHPLLLLLLLLSLGLGAAGQLSLDQQREHIHQGLLLYAAAIAVFSAAILGWRRDGLEAKLQRQMLQVWRDLRDLSGQYWRIILVLTAVLGTVAALVLIQSRPESYLLPFLLWLAAGLSICVAVAPRWPRPSWVRVRAWLAARRVEALAVSGLLLAAFVLRAWSIDTIPATLGGDEGSQGLEAVRVLQGQLRNPFDTGWYSVPTMSFFWQAIWLWLFGADIFGLRLPWAVLGTATILTSYLLLRQFMGPRFAFAAGVLLAGYDYHIHYSRLGSNQVADPLFISAALYLLVRGVRRWRAFEFALCGALVGLSQYFYAGARLTAIVVVLTLAMLLWKERRLWREGKRFLAVLMVSGLIVGAPMLQYALQRPDDYNARMNQVGIIQSGWLEREQVARNQGALSILWDQFQRTALAFNFYPDRTVWYGNPRPLLGFPASVLFVLGLVYATVRLADRRLFPFVGWLWSATILGGMLTESPPSSQRLITLAVPAVFFVTLGLDRLLKLVRRAWSMRLPLTPVILVAALGLSVLSARYYFVDYTPQRIYGSENAWVATEAGKYLRELGPDYHAYFFGTPRMFYGFASIPYLAPGVQGQDVTQPLTAPPTFVRQDKHAVFILLPERERELTWVRRAYPNGTLREFHNPIKNQHLFVAYEVSREQLARH